MDKLTYYDDVKKRNVINLVKPLLQSGYKLRDSDGKIYAEMSIGFDTPWHHIYHAHELDCHLWHSIIFNVIYLRLHKRYVPLPCQNCWKVVVRPKTLKQLFALEALQKRLHMPSKCGIEVRETVCGHYGGYFYNTDLESGVQCYMRVRNAVNEDSDLGPDVVVILKRACTEFEAEAGPSDQWENLITQEQVEIEDLINRTFVRDIVQRSQPDHVIDAVHQRWVEWACQNADMTYLEYTGKPLFRPYVTYHHLAEKTGEERTQIYNKLNARELKLRDIRPEEQTKVLEQYPDGK